MCIVLRFWTARAAGAKCVCSPRAISTSRRASRRMAVCCFMPPARAPKACSTPFRRMPGYGNVWCWQMAMYANRRGHRCANDEVRTAGFRRIDLLTRSREEQIMHTTTRILIAALAVASNAACSKPKKSEPPPAASEQQRSETKTEAQRTDGRFRPEDLQSNACLRQRVVYFDFDKADIKPEAQAAMNCHGKYLKDNPSARVTLEGHADERGTREYNLGLGER